MTVPGENTIAAAGPEGRSALDGADEQGRRLRECPAVLCAGFDLFTAVTAERAGAGR